MNEIKKMWNNRYAAAEYSYGIAPNVFFSNALKDYKISGKLLLPAEGEGRNAVYAAKQGLEVTAFDISEAGKKKALQLAAKEGVSIAYAVGDFLELDIVNQQYDAAALIFAHFPPSLLSKYHKEIGALIKPNGLVVLEGFSKNHIAYQEKNPKVGGPKHIDLLFSKEAIAADFADFDVLYLEEVEVALDEGRFHQGLGSVIRFVGRKRAS